MNVVQVWKVVLKWGLGQNPELSSDPTSLSKDDFNTLKNTLQQCIPFIRFYNLTSKEFLNKVFPYKKILPKDLYVDLLKDYLNHDGMPPSNKSKSRNSRIDKGISSIDIDSNVITLQHAGLILKWINRLNITD